MYVCMYVRVCMHLGMLPIHAQAYIHMYTCIAHTHIYIYTHTDAHHITMTQDPVARCLYKLASWSGAPTVAASCSCQGRLHLF